jgi:cyclic pyranopterin monophosphate synthase
MTSGEPPLTHLNQAGEAHMVDVGAKEETARRAVAEAVVAMSAGLADRLFSGDLPKGDALAAVRLAGIMGAKRTPDLIPLAHPIGLDSVEITVERHEGGVRIEAECGVTGRTGVEMEALTAVSVAALALYDMVKSIERGVVIGPVRLLSKRGGRSGEWEADSPHSLFET